MFAHRLFELLALGRGEPLMLGLQGQGSEPHRAQGLGCTMEQRQGDLRARPAHYGSTEAIGAAGAPDDCRARPGTLFCPLSLG